MSMKAESSAELPKDSVQAKIIALRDRYQRERVDRDWTDWYDGGIETCNRILTMLDDSRTEQAYRLTPAAYSRLLLLIGNASYTSTVPTQEELEAAING